MTDPPRMVPCQLCAWRITQPEYDETKENCRRCNNTRLTKDPRDILCNLCGETMCPIGTMNEQEPHGLSNVDVIGGYDSYHLADMRSYTFSFCEKCLRDLFVKCKIKPIIHELSFGSASEFYFKKENIVSFEEDQEQYEYRTWCDTGGHHQAYLNKFCNTKKDCKNKALYTAIYRDNDFSEDSCCEEHKERYVGGQNYKYYKLVKFIPNVLKSFL